MPALRVHHWQNEYRMPRTDPDPAARTRALDRLVQPLAQQFAEHLQSVVDDTQEGIVLMPSLELDLDIDTAASPEQIVRHWSRALAFAFARALDDPAGGIVRLRSRAHFDARFIAALLEDRCWESWLFRSYEGLRSLPVATAIRTVLTGPAGTGMTALSLIGAALWPLLFARLGAREAVRILAHWHEKQLPGAASGRLAAALACWSGAAPGSLPPPLLALWLLARAGRGGENPADAGTDHATAPDIGAACWIACLLSMPGSTPESVLRDIARRIGLGAVARAPLAIHDPDWLRMLATTPLALRSAAAEMAIAARAAAQRTSAVPSDSPDETLDAPFAGLALLLPAVLDLVDRDLLAALPPVAADTGCAPLDLVALLVLALAAYRHREPVWHDPFWRSFLRVPPAVDVPALHDWLATHDAEPCRIALARSLQKRTLTEAVRLRFSVAGERLERIVERGSGSRLHAGAPPADLADAALPFAERLMLTRLLKQDCALLAAGTLYAALPADWQDLFATLTQGVLRRTGYRIPGLACSSLPYLFANVLEMRGQSRQGAEAPAAAWTLETGRPPLHVLLSLNGMSRLRLDWPGQRSLALHCAG